MDTATPNVFMFTNDAGTDFTVAHNATTTLSSLASIGTITTGTWNGTVIAEAYLPNASATAEGVVEHATVAELETGTDTGRTITPDVLAGSNFGERVVEIFVVERATDVTLGEGKADFHVPSTLAGMNLVEVHAEVITAGTTNTTDIQITNVTIPASPVDMLSTKLTINSGDTGSDTATAAVIDDANDDVTTNDMLRIDVDAVSTTARRG